MFRARGSIRFTPHEIEKFRSLGLDFDGVRTPDDIEQALTAWVEVLADERPDLLDKIASEMVKAKGVKPLARLTTVVCGAPSSGSPGRS